MSTVSTTNYRNSFFTRSDNACVQGFAIIKICKFTVFSSGSFFQIHRVTDEAFFFFFFFEDNGTPSVTEDYLPCAMMLFTMKFG